MGTHYKFNHSNSSDIHNYISLHRIKQQREAEKRRILSDAPFCRLSLAESRRLALDGAYHYALDEILLNEGVNAKDRQGCEDDGRILNELLVKVEAAGVLPEVDFGSTGALNEYFTKDYLERIKLSVRKIDGCGEVFVPLTDGIEERDNRDSRLGKRKNYLEQYRKMACAVELSGFFKARGKGLESSLDNDDVENGDKTHYNDNPSGINDTEVFVNHVGRDKTAVEEHREGEHYRKVFEPKVLSSRHTISGERRKDDAEDAADADVEDGVGVTSYEGVVAKNY